jgi:Carbohydrate-selective porin, OprB family
MMQFFILACLNRSALLGMLAGTTLVGFCGVGGSAIAAHQESAVQPQKDATSSVAIPLNHWAFQSLKALVKRYGCEVSLSSLHFQSAHVPTRDEMATALNECLDQIANHFETMEDRSAAQALQKEFKQESETLRAKTRILEDRAAILKARPLPSTSKLIVDRAYNPQFPVQPTHWSFQAVQSLAERYQCTPNTPDGIFSGKVGAISRYEMAAFLNTCLNRIGHRFANQKDLETAQALQREFKPELTALKDRVDSLEDRAAMLEPQQFSTTTKLQGQAIITIQGGGFQ